MRITKLPVGWCRVFEAHKYRSTSIRLLLGIFACCGTVAADDRGPKGADPARPPAIVTESVPPLDPQLVERLAQYQEVRAAGFRGWAPDGDGILISTRFGDTPQLHRVYTPGGRREQITFFREPVSGRFIPHGDGDILLSMSKGGNENDQVYILNRKTGRPLLLTDGKSRNSAGPFRPDGKQLIVRNNSRNGRDTDLYLYDPHKPGPLATILQTNKQLWVPTDWSKSENKLSMIRFVSATESYPALFELDGKKFQELPNPGAQGGTSSCDSIRFRGKARGVFLTSDALGEFTQLAYWSSALEPDGLHPRDEKSKGYTWLSEKIPWDVEEIEPHPDRDFLAFVVNQDGLSVLYFLEGLGKPVRVELPDGLLSGLEFSPDGNHLGFTFARPNAPADAYSLKLSDKTLTRWTYSEVGGLDTSTFIAPTVIRFPSFDGREIPAYYSRPRTASKDKPAPVVIEIHGGPESQYRPYFSGVNQFYLNDLGIAAISPNVRGSSGYGKTFLKLDNAELREDSVRDIGALLDWIARQPELDKNRVAVMGGSYGGYMTLASLVHYSDRLKCGIDVVGIASFKSFLKNTSAYRQDLRRVEYGDERDPKMQTVFEKIDPLNHADKITAALMVIHGKNDPRVPFSEAEQIARQVRSNGREVWTVFADNEGHGFGKKANRDYQTAVVAMFLKKHLVTGK